MKGPNKKIITILVSIIILLAIGLISIAIREQYPSRIYNRIFPAPEVEWDYNWNQSYENCTTIYPLYTEQKNIVMLGTSLTAYGQWSEILNRSDVANRGVGGDVTKGMLSRLQNIIDLKPKIVFIEGGINDIGHNVPVDSIMHRFDAIITALQDKDIKPVITTITLLAKQYGSPETLNKNIIDLNLKIVELSREYSIPLIDLNQYVSGKDYINDGYTVKDGVHFTDKTYQVWKREVEKILNSEKL